MVDGTSSDFKGLEQNGSQHALCGILAFQEQKTVS
jgi:hypothetical protein